jgi:hypothetical protein
MEGSAEQQPDCQEDTCPSSAQDSATSRAAPEGAPSSSPLAATVGQRGRESRNQADRQRRPKATRAVEILPQLLSPLPRAARGYSAKTTHHRSAWAKENRSKKGKTPMPLLPSPCSSPPQPVSKEESSKTRMTQSRGGVEISHLQNQPPRPAKG